MVSPRRIRYWRDRARAIVISGVVIYAAGFFLDWLLGYELYWLLTWTGGFIVLVGACCGLLWLADSSPGSRETPPPDDPRN